MKHRYSGKNHIWNKIHHLFPDKIFLGKEKKHTHPPKNWKWREIQLLTMRLLNLLSFVFCFVLFVLIWFSLLERFWCFSLHHPHSLQLPCNFQGDLKVMVPQKWCQGSSQGAVHKLSAPIRTQDGAWPLENLQAWSVSWEVTVFRNYWRERVEREVGGGIGMGKSCKPKAVSFQCMTKFTTN